MGQPRILCLLGLCMTQFFGAPALRLTRHWARVCCLPPWARKSLHIIDRSELITSPSRLAISERDNCSTEFIWVLPDSYGKRQGRSDVRTPPVIPSAEP